ncbi:MAG: hypothetical protein IT380_24480, partial [Myxococcales bacterium]|nr:hypothetical protein [Myxococcales bacterium]
KPLASYYQVWTTWLTGDVDLGIWGQGCNASEQKYGFTLAEVRRDAPVRPPLVLGLPGQKQRADGTWDNWYRTYVADVGRYLSPEPLLQSPLYVRHMAQAGLQVPTYAYAANNPLMYVDPDGGGIKTWAKAIALAMHMATTKKIGKVKGALDETTQLSKEAAQKYAKEKRTACGPGPDPDDIPDHRRFTPKEFLDLFLPDILIIDPELLREAMGPMPGDPINESFQVY